MNLILIGLFLVLPAIELAVMIKVGTLIGVLPTLGLIVLTAIIGASLMRRQGAQAMGDLQRAFAEFRDPSVHIADGAVILLAGGLMLVPGFLTDFLGVLLLIPPVRRGVIAWASPRIRSRRRMAGGVSTPPRPEDWSTDWQTTARGHRPSTVIDAEFVEIDTPEGGPTPPRRPSGWTQP